jgi:serine protease Do
MGIVSAKGRADLHIVDYGDFIQTDAAINLGNSGGALISTRGELIGINTAIANPGHATNIGFAIPSDMARPIMQSLIQHGKVFRGQLGVAIQDIDPELAKALNLPSSEGVLVTDVREDGPASKAGLKRGDVITEVNGRTVNTTGELRNLIAGLGARSIAKLIIFRDGHRQSLSVSLGEMPAPTAQRGPPSPAPNREPTSLEGLTLDDLTPVNKKRFKIADRIKSGVVVTGVAPTSPAAEADLETGDVILEINRTPVSSPAELGQLWKRSKGNVLLLVDRQGWTHYVLIKR